MSEIVMILGPRFTGTILAAILLVFPTFCWVHADEKGTDVYEISIEKSKGEIQLDEIIVTATRTRLYSRDTVGLDSIERESQSKTVEGLLDHLAGVDLNRRSFAGNENSRLSIRGFDESRSLILQDGRSLHGSGVYGGYYVDWGSLSLEDVERVEIIRGIAPAKFGNTLGGVVNILTRKGSRKRRTELRAGGGSLGTWNFETSHSGPAGPATYSISAGHYETDGYLRNASVERNMISAGLQFSLPAEIKLNASVRFTENKAGMIVYNMPDAWRYDPDEPDALGAQLGGPYVAFKEHQTGSLDWGDGSYWKDRRLNLDLGISRESSNMDFSLRTYLIDQDREERFYAVDDSDHLVLRRDSKPERSNWGWRVDFKNRVGEKSDHVLEYGMEGHYLGYGGMTVKKVDPNYLKWPPADSPSKEEPVTQLHGVYFQDLWRVGETVQIQAGLRLDGFRADGPEANAVTVEEEKLAPRIACTLEPWERGKMTFRFGRAYRFPTVPEYYWWYSGYQPAGRKDLTSEKANQYEIELGQELGEDLHLLVRGYYYEVDDYIRTIFGYKPSRVVYNIGEVQFRGVELEIGYNVSPNLRLWANYTRQETEKEGDILDQSMSLTDELPELPEDKANIGVSYVREKGIRAELKIGYVDERRTTMGDLTKPGGSYLAKMDSYVDVDLRLSYPLYQNENGTEVRLEIAGENLLNEDIEEDYGYPMPGRAVMAGLSAVF